MNKSDALVVFSGGQDSTTCLFWAKKHFRKVYALSFIYGQKHVKEVELARAIAGKAGVEFKAMDVSFIGNLGKNSLTDTTITMDEVKPADSFPNTFVPGRNLFFLSIAAVYARELGINHIVTGVSLGTFQLSGVYQPMPDNRAAGFCGNSYQLPAGCEDGGKQELEAVFVQFP